MSDQPDPLVEKLDTATTEAWRANVAGRIGAPHPLYPALAAALRVLAEWQLNDMRAAHEAAQAAHIATHKHDFLGERAAYQRTHERLTALAAVIEKGVKRRV